MILCQALKVFVRPFEKFIEHSEIVVGRSLLNIAFNCLKDKKFHSKFNILIH